jgi:hypothetical protein
MNNLLVKIVQSMLSAYQLYSNVDTVHTYCFDELMYIYAPWLQTRPISGPDLNSGSDLNIFFRKTGSRSESGSPHQRSIHEKGKF